ncbi:MAG: KH domain-containing protein [Thermoanaerobaculia bacterium]
MPTSVTSEIRDQLLALIRGMVDHPEEVELVDVEGPRAWVFELRVAEEDLGQVIGRQGRTAQALRTVLEARASETGGRYEFKILDD